jgi:hypothetical protein
MTKPVRQIDSERLGDLVETCVDALVRVNVTAKTMADNKTAYVAQMKKLGATPSDPYLKPTMGACEYRGHAIQIPVTSPLDHYNSAAESRVLGIAVDAGIVDPMFSEHDLVGPRPAVAISVATELVQDNINARVAMHSYLAASDASGPAILQMLAAREKFLLSIDTRFKVSSAFWRSSIGESAKPRIQDALLQCLPNDGVKMSVTEVAAKVNKLAISKLAIFAGPVCESHPQNMSWMRSWRVASQLGTRSTALSRFVSRNALAICCMWLNQDPRTGLRSC